MIVVLISIFLFITYFFSVYDKVSSMERTTAYYSDHFKNTWVLKILKPSLWMIVLAEFLICIFLVFGVNDYLLNQNHELLKTTFLCSSSLLILFLIGQRIAKDYQGATSLTVYFIVNIIGIYLL